MQIYPIATVELSYVESCSKEELMRIAEKIGFNSDEYKIVKTK